MWNRKSNPSVRPTPSFLARWRSWLSHFGVGLTLTLVAGVLVWTLTNPFPLGSLAIWAIGQILRGEDPPPIPTPDLRGPPAPIALFVSPDPTPTPGLGLQDFKDPDPDANDA